MLQICKNTEINLLNVDNQYLADSNKFIYN